MEQKFTTAVINIVQNLNNLKPASLIDNFSFLIIGSRYLTSIYLADQM